MDHLDTMTFWSVFGAAEISGFVLLILMGYWTGVMRGGFAWQEDPKKEFNLHPLFMTIGLIYLYGNGMILYRVFRDQKKKTLKLLHASIMMGSFIFMVIALKAAFDSHDLNKPNPIPNMYSLHSWMGIIAATLFTIQWVGGFMIFLVPGMPIIAKELYLDIHTWLGAFIFVLSCATALIGVTEKMIFMTAYAPKTSPLNGFYQRKEPEGLLMNTTSLVIILFGALVVFLATSTKFKRLPLPEEIPASEEHKLE